MTEELSGVTVVIIIGLGFLTFLSLFIFAKRQIMRFSLRSRRGPHVPIGHNAKKVLKREIERRIDYIPKISTEPQLVQRDPRYILYPGQKVPCHYYRFKAVDDLTLLEEEIKLQDNFVRHPTVNIRGFLLTTLADPLKGNDQRLIHQFCDLYEHARHDPNYFGEYEYQAYNRLLYKLIDAAKLLKLMNSSSRRSSPNRTPQKQRNRNLLDPSRLKHFANIEDEISCVKQMHDGCRPHSLVVPTGIPPVDNETFSKRDMFKFKGTVLYDFLDAKLLPKVECAAAAMDNYEISNLISNNEMIRARGFLAYISMKPPVDIEFELLASTSINFVSISSKVGNQHVTGIELYGKNSKSDYVLLGNALFNEPGVIFCNIRYYSKDKRPENTDNNFHLSWLKQRAFRTIINANKLKIRIFRTNKCVPCLGSVKIVGKISKCCSKSTAETIEKLMNNTCSNPIKSNSAQVDEQIFEIPEEFKDALTFEIMTIPMTLPSGHSIDQTTLEKCLENDVRCGRHSLDPFTGIPFAANKKPVLNVALKSRIDMFLMQNAHKTETYHLKRTLGRKTPSAAAYCSEKPRYASNINEKRLKDDVGYDCGEMNRILKSLRENSNYIAFLNDERPSEAEIISKCTNCDVMINLYKLPCNDLYCRICLLKICNEEICGKCKQSFQRKDVEKYNG